MFIKTNQICLLGFKYITLVVTLNTRLQKLLVLM